MARRLVLVTCRCQHVAPLGAPSRRRYGAGPRFLTFRFVLPPALSCDPFWAAASFEPRASLTARRQRASRGGHSAPGGTPAPPECRRSVRLLPAGAASDPTCMTPHDSALGGSDVANINALEEAGISFWSSFVLLCRRRNSVTLLAAGGRHSLWSARAGVVQW